jgi:hypothetical protein
VRSFSTVINCDLKNAIFNGGSAKCVVFNGRHLADVIITSGKDWHLADVIITSGKKAIAPCFTGFKQPPHKNTLLEKQLANNLATLSSPTNRPTDQQTNRPANMCQSAGLQSIFFCFVVA